MQACVCSVARSEPNLTADLARASGAKEKALLTTNSLSVCVSLTYTTLLKVSHCANTSFQNMCYWPGVQGKKLVKEGGLWREREEKKNGSGWDKVSREKHSNSLSS